MQLEIKLVKWTMRSFEYLMCISSRLKGIFNGSLLIGNDGKEGEGGERLNSLQFKNHILCKSQFHFLIVQECWEIEI